MSSRGKYIITGDTPQEVRNDINFALQQISDRLDRIEGIRGGSKIESNLDMSSKNIENVNSLSGSSVSADSATATDFTSTTSTIDTGTITTLTADNFSLVQQKWDDLTADLSAGKAVGANAPTWATFRDGISAYSFSAGTMNELWIVFHLDHKYARATNIYPHIHNSPGSSTNTGTVRWGFEWTFCEGFAQSTTGFPTTQTIYLEQAYDGTAYQHYVTEASDDQAFGSDILETDGLLLVRIFRDAADAADTFPDVAFGLTADIHYQVEQIATPNKAPPFF